MCAGVATAFHRAHGPETFHGFVLGHALNVRRTLLNGRRTPLVDIEGLDRPAPEPISSEFEVQDFERLRDALGDLPDRERQALGLRYFDELSAAQIARALGVSEVNARRIVFNGLRRLRQRFQVPRGAQPRKG